MTESLVGQWVSEDVLRRASDLNLEVVVEKMNWTKNPLDKRGMVYVAGFDSLRVSQDCHYQQAMDYSKASITTFAARHAKEYGLDLKDMLRYPVFVSERSNINYSTDGRKKTPSGFLYLSKKAVRKQYDVNSVSQRIKLAVKEGVETALRELSLWSYGEVYDIALIYKNVAVVKATEVYDLSKIDSLVVGLLDDVADKGLI